MRIYLAGDMKSGWQDKVLEKIGDKHLFLDPRSWEHPDPAVYTDRDLAAVRTSDCVLAYMDSSNPSGYGLSLEVGYACGLGKNIILWDNFDNDWRSKYFGMHRVIATTLCHSLETVLETIERYEKWNRGK